MAGRRLVIESGGAPPGREPGHRKNSDLGARLVVAIPAATGAAILIAIGDYAFAALLVFLAVACIAELFTLYARIEPHRFGGMLGVVALIVAAYAGEQFHVMLTFVAWMAALFVLILLSGQRTGASGMMVTVFGVAWIGLAMAHGMLLREEPHGAAVLVDILVGTFIGDTGAYFGGRALGRRKLSPSVSPNKTVEGLFIGMVTAVVATWLAGTYQDWLSGTDALLLGVGVALAAPLGDLFESYVKREAHAKDTGRLFGAHGGALDRLDAVFFSVVTGYYIWLSLL